VLKAAGLRSVSGALQRTTSEAADRGVTSVPAIWTEAALFDGVDSLDAAASALAAC